MKKNFLYLILILALIIGGYFLMAKGSSGETIEGDYQNYGEKDGNFQKVTIGIKNFNYYPNTITVKANQPVRIYLDESVDGCYRSFTIREMGIAKYLKTPNDYVEFTPTKPGTYRFACSMGMGTGKLVVE